MVVSIQHSKKSKETTVVFFSVVKLHCFERFAIPHHLLRSFIFHLQYDKLCSWDCVHVWGPHNFFDIRHVYCLDTTNCNVMQYFQMFWILPDQQIEFTCFDNYPNTCCDCGKIHALCTVKTFTKPKTAGKKLRNFLTMTFYHIKKNTHAPSGKQTSNIFCWKNMFNPNLPFNKYQVIEIVLLPTINPIINKQ